MKYKVGDKLTITFPIIGFSNLAESITLLMEPYAFNNRLDQVLGDTNIISYEILDIWASKTQARVTILILKSADPSLELKISADELLRFLGDFPVDHSVFNAIIKYLSNKHGLPAENILLETISESSSVAGLFDSSYKIRYRLIEKSESKLNDKKYPKIKGREFYG